MLSSPCRQTARVASLAALMLILSACNSGPPPGGVRVNTSPVSGIVEVDDKPAANVTVTCHPEPSDGATSYPSTGTTNAEGRFEMSTFKSGDGLANGAYSATFALEDPAKGGRDALRGAYRDPAKSEVKFTVAGGKAVDLGVIKLSTKKSK